MAWDKGKYRTVGVAVSGGVDSMCLLHAFVSLGQPVLAVHVEHGIRGEQSVEDMRFVQSYCDRNGIPLVVYRADVPSYAEQTGLSLETAAREIRYRYFDDLLASGQADVIATAHHLDDQVETVCMRILRGTGIAGLAGLGQRDGYVRPLLGVTRAELVAYAQSEGIPYRQDATNFDQEPTRNWLRLSLLPLVESRFPAYRGAIARLAAAAKEQAELSEQLAISPEIRPFYVRLPLAALDQPAALAKWSVRRSVLPLTLAVDMEEVHYQRVLALKTQPNGTSLDLAQGVVCRKGGEGLYFWQKTPPVDLPFAVGTVETETCRVTVRPYQEGDRLRFDLDKIPSTARIRTRKDGDVVAKFGGGTKSLGDYYTDSKLPYPLRELPIVAAGCHTLVCPQDVSREVAQEDKTTRLYTLIWEEL